VATYAAYLVTTTAGKTNFTCHAMVTFNVTSVNTLTVLNAPPFSTGVLVRFTAPRRHTVWDLIELINANCTSSCIMRSVNVPEGPEGLVHLALNPARDEGISVYVRYVVCFGHVGLGLTPAITATSSV
jgi:hypothetical protein